MSGRVTRKRARTEEENDSAVAKSEENGQAGGSDGAEAAEAILKKDEEFWLEDGTIVLVTGDIEFRVYGGLLANHSPVLKEEFAKPHPTRSTLVHGAGFFLCPVVHLSDSPHDLRHLLRACMPSSNAT